MKNSLVFALLLLGAGSVFAQAASAPAAATTANASVVCKDEKSTKTVTSSATGNGARATASCGGVAHFHKQKVVAKLATTEGGDAATVRALAEANIALRASIASARVGVFMPAPTYAEDGKVYSDPSGNTYERHQAGSRLCRFMVNGQVRKEVFVQNPDLVDSKKQCDVLAMEFEATLLPTTQVAATAPTAVSVNQPQPQAQGIGKVTCELKYNGSVVENTTTADDASCKAWTLEQARKRGWTPKT